MIPRHLPALVLTGALVLAGCGTLPVRDRLDIPPAPASTASPADAAEPEETPDVTDQPAAIGQAWRYGDGVTVAVTKLQSTRVPEISAGGSPGDPAVVVTVKVTNNGAKRLDVGQLSIDVRTGKDGEPAERVFASGFDNADGSLAKGRSYTFKAMFAADAPFKQVAVDVEPTWDYEPALFEGRI